MHRHYWFRPARFGIFAGYYPVNAAGWTITIFTFFALLFVLMLADATSHSISDTLISTAPSAIIILLIFDLISFRTGEYPHWWRNWGRGKK